MELIDLIEQKEAIELKIQEARNDVTKVANLIKKMMATYGVTVEMLDLPVKKAVKKVAPKWKDPVSGKTWTGRGIKPKWYDAATAISL